MFKNISPEIFQFEIFLIEFSDDKSDHEIFEKIFYSRKILRLVCMYIYTYSCIYNLSQVVYWVFIFL